MRFGLRESRSLLTWWGPPDYPKGVLTIVTETWYTWYTEVNQTLFGHFIKKWYFDEHFVWAPDGPGHHVQFAARNETSLDRFKAKLSLSSKIDTSQVNQKLLLMTPSLFRIRIIMKNNRALRYSIVIFLIFAILFQLLRRRFPIQFSLTEIRKAELNWKSAYWEFNWGR